MLHFLLSLTTPSFSDGQEFGERTNMSEKLTETKRKAQSLICVDNGKRRQMNGLSVRKSTVMFYKRFALICCAAIAAELSLSKIISGRWWVGLPVSIEQKEKHFSLRKTDEQNMIRLFVLPQ